MTLRPSLPVKPVLPLTRLIFVTSVLLAGIAGVQLYVLSDHTDRYFAWTIGNPLSATFIGGGYWTGTLLLLFALREDAWANVRVALAAVATFIPLMLLTTLLHLESFHFHSSGLGPRVAAWTWMIVYIGAPLAVGLIFVLQLRAPGGEPSAGPPVPAWVRALLGANGVVSLVVGLALMLVPAHLFSLWPWQLTELTARAVGTGFLTLAIASLWFVRENSWVRGRVGAVPFLSIGVLQLIALVRYEGKVEWTRPGAWLYLLFLIGVLSGGIYSTRMAWRLGLGEVEGIGVAPREA